MATDGSSGTGSTDCLEEEGNVPAAGVLGSLDNFFSSLTGSRVYSLERTILTSLCIVSSAERRRASVAR